MSAENSNKREDSGCAIFAIFVIAVVILWDAIGQLDKRIKVLERKAGIVQPDLREKDAPR